MGKVNIIVFFLALRRVGAGYLGPSSARFSALKVETLTAEVEIEETSIPACIGRLVADCWREVPSGFSICLGEHCS